MNPTIAGLIDAAHEAQAEVRSAIRGVELAKREVTKKETALVGAKVRAREAEEILRLARSSEVVYYVTQREVDLAAMKGIYLAVGQELTPDIKEALRCEPLGKAIKELIERV